MRHSAAAAAPPFGGLVATLERLRDRLEALRLPLELPGVDEARTARRRMLEQLGDYVLPRLERLDAPLLVVIGGSTGAGKSTLVNSLVGREVSASGVRRPTTRGPVLAHHPDDAHWFEQRRLLPGLARITGASAAADPRGLLLVATDAVPRNLALLDAPDIDSVVAGNRELAAQLLAAADLWLFLTTAARYADAVPWDLLREASERSASVAVVLDRVPPAAIQEVSTHLAEMLRDEGLGESPLVVIPESELEHGLLPAGAFEGLRTWLHALAEDKEARTAIARTTLAGVLGAYKQRLPPLVAAIEAQESTAARLRGDVVGAYDEAGEQVEEAVRDGSLLRGEVLARWQDVVGTGEFMRSLESRVGRLRDRVFAAVRGRPQPTEELAGAIETGVAALVRSESDRAAERSVARWRDDPAGRVLLEGEAGLDRSSESMGERLERAVRDWQGFVLDLVRSEGAGKRRSAQFMSYGVNGTALVVMVAVFASTGGLTGGEIVVAGGASALSQKVLEALLGDQAVRSLAARARVDLRDRVDVLLAGEAQRFTELLDAQAAGEVGAADLRDAGRDVERALRERR